jgi:hypothetical protein
VFSLVFGYKFIANIEAFIANAKGPAAYQAGSFGRRFGAWLKVQFNRTHKGAKRAVLIQNSSFAVVWVTKQLAKSAHTLIANDYSRFFNDESDCIARFLAKGASFLSLALHF